MEIIPYGEKLKAGLIGVVAPDGTFYAIAKTGTLSACHQEELRKLSILLSKEQPCNTLGSLFYKKREQIEHPEEFYLGDTFDYKVGFIDYGDFVITNLLVVPIPLQPSWFLDTKSIKKR